MSIVTVLEKLYGSCLPATFEEFISRLFCGLSVQLRFAGQTDRGWIKLDILGADKTVALSLLDREVGLVPASLDCLEKFSVMRGKIVFSGKGQSELYVDLGLDSSETCDAVLSENHLRAQLADGRKLSLQRLIELFCLYDNVPFEVKITKKVEVNNKNVEAILSEHQLSLFRNWIRCRFDRLLVLGSFLSDVEQAVNSSRHSRDIIRTESLGVLEQVVLCKLGTDAVGLIPKLGRYLKSAILVPFSPKKILKAIGSQPFDW